MAEFQKQLIESIIIVLIVIIAYIGAKKFATNILLKNAKRKSDKRALTTITVTTNVLKYLLYIVTILIILDVWGVDTKALLASLGVVGVIVGLALQDLLKDIIAGIAILTEFAVSICNDSGETAIASKIDVGGKIIIVALSTPIIQALMETVLKVLP